MEVITEQTTSDGYTDVCTIADVFNSNGGGFNVSGNPVFMSLQYGRLGQGTWTIDIFVPVGTGTLLAGTTGVKFRSFTSGQPAVVSAALAERSEPGFAIGAGGQSAVSSNLTAPVTIGNDTGAQTALTVTEIYTTAANGRVFIGALMQNPIAGNIVALHVNAQGKGTTVTGNGYRGIEVDTQDLSGLVVNKSITNAVNNGAGLIRITCPGHTFATGDEIAIYGVVGTTEANNSWTITVIDVNTFDLIGSAFVHGYVGGGTATNRPYSIGVYVAVQPLLDRGGLQGNAVNADDCDGFAAQNVGTHLATDAYYLAASPLIAGSAWVTGFAIDANCNTAIGIARGGATISQYGIDFNGGAYGLGAIRLPNNVEVVGRNAAGSADVAMFKLNGSNLLEFDAPVFLPDGVDVAMGTVTGSHFPFAANEKLGFWGQTPVVQQVLATGAGHTVDDVITFLQLVGLCRQS